MLQQRTAERPPASHSPFLVYANALKLNLECTALYTDDASKRTVKHHVAFHSATKPHMERVGQTPIDNTLLWFCVTLMLGVCD